MLNALFDPGVLITSEAIWNCESSKKAFLGRLTRHLKFLDYIKDGFIIWCDELEARLWSQPPWKRDRAFNIMLSQTLYVSLSKYCQKYSISECEPAECNNSLSCHCNEDIGIFLRLVSASLKIQLSPYFCPCEENIKDDDHKFRVDSSSAWVLFPEVKDPASWPKVIKPIELYWPISCNEGNKFKKCIELVAKSKDISPSEFQLYEFSDNFLRDIITASRKEKIAEMIVHRLTLSLQEATKDPQLQDEELSNGDRRFRVTQRPSSLRIHYAFQNNSIIFKRFYDAGHHDDGL